MGGNRRREEGKEKQKTGKRTFNTGKEKLYYYMFTLEIL